MASLRGRFAASPRGASGLSIAITSERIRQIGGTFELTSSPGLLIRATAPAELSSRRLAINRSASLQDGHFHFALSSDHVDAHPVSLPAND